MEECVQATEDDRKQLESVCIAAAEGSSLISPVSYMCSIAA